MAFCEWSTGKDLWDAMVRLWSPFKDKWHGELKEGVEYAMASEWEEAKKKREQSYEDFEKKEYLRLKKKYENDGL